MDLEESDTRVINIKNNNKNTENEPEPISNYIYRGQDLSKSLESHASHSLYDLHSDSSERLETQQGLSSMNTETMTDMRSVRNDEIHQKEHVNKNESYLQNDTNSPLLLNVMLWVSNSVSLMLFSLFITLIVTRKKEWFFILLSVFIIVTCAEIFKIITMRFNADFLYRPGKCVSEHTTTDMLFYRNFILERILKSIDMSRYQQMGFPSMHVIQSASILTLIYLFFPKYKKIMLITSPIYLILIGFSRIYLSCHTLLQVVAGIVGGILGGKLMYNIFK
jgi:membrane-associated phospholipid phosphatase